MRAGMLGCPGCGGQDIVDHRTGRHVPWLVRQEPSTRRATGLFAAVGGLVLAADGLVLGALAVDRRLAPFYLALATAGAAALVLVGLRVTVRSMRAVTQEPEDLVCNLCSTTWSATAPTPTPGEVVPADARLPRQREPESTAGSALASWESHIHRTLGGHQPPEPIARVLEDQRIDTVRLIGRHGLVQQASGRGDGGDAVDALLRLLPLETGYLPPTAAGTPPRTMAHAVLEQLAELDDHRAVVPVTAYLHRMRRRAREADPADQQSSARAAVAEDLAAAAAQTLARLAHLHVVRVPGLR